MMKTIHFNTVTFTLIAFMSVVPTVWANTQQPHLHSLYQKGYQKGSYLALPSKTVPTTKKVVPVQNVQPKTVPVYRAPQEIYNKNNQLVNKIGNKGTPMPIPIQKTKQNTVVAVKPSTQPAQYHPPTPPVSSQTVVNHTQTSRPTNRFSTDNVPPIPENGANALDIWMENYHTPKSYTPPQVTTVAPHPQPQPVELVKKNTSSSSSILMPKNSLGASTYQHYSSKQEDYTDLVVQAENHATGSIKNILKEARMMTLYRKEIIQGSCWDYLDRAWTRAGISRNLRQSVFGGEKNNGHYASTDSLRAGDWLYHINYGYKNIEHSGMFIAWVDKSKNLGLTLSYAGEGRKEPARYKVYDLSGVYHIMRPKI